MTTNQTIDGVPRAVIAAFAKVADSYSEAEDDSYEPWQDAMMHAELRLTLGKFRELRALLDAPYPPEAQLIAAGLGYPMSKEDAVKAYKASLAPRTDSPINADCEWCHGCGHDPYGEPCVGCCKPAAQPQSETVAIDERELYDAWRKSNLGYVRPFNKYEWSAWQARALHAEQPAPVAVVPEGYCIMPRQLTAENGAKALLLGEFKLLVNKECPECCELEEPTEGCSICDGEGESGQKHTIPWDQIKYIYSKAVSGLAVKTESAKSR